MLVYLYTRHRLILSSSILIIVTMMEPHESISKKRKFNADGHENNEDDPCRKVARNEQPPTTSSLAFWEQAKDYLSKTFHQQYKDSNCA